MKKAFVLKFAEDEKPADKDKEPADEGGLTWDSLAAQAMGELAEKHDEIPEWFVKAYMSL